MKQEKILHFGTTIVTNSSHKSVPSRFAYSVGIKVKDEKTNKTYHSQKKSKEDGIETEMILNSAASEKFKDTNYFFNKINNEKRADGRVFYEFNVTLYQGLTKEENKNIARDFAQQFSEKYETPTSVSFHKMDSDNPHFHIIFSERTVSGEELSKKKNDKMRGQNFIPTSRKLFSDVSNEHFNKLGKEFFVDHRSYKDRGLEKQPLRRVNKKSKIQDIDLIKLENKIIKIENKEIEYKQKYNEIKSEHHKKTIETKHKLEKAVVAKTPGKEVKNMEAAKIQTVHKLYNKEIKKQEDKFLTKRKEHKEQKQQNVLHRANLNERKQHYKEQRQKSKELVNLKKDDVMEMRLKQQELKLELKGHSKLNPYVWKERRAIKQKIAKNKIQQKRKKFEIKKEKAKQKFQKKRMKEHQKNYRKEKKKEFGLLKDQVTAKIKAKVINREKGKVVNKEVSNKIVNLAEYKKTHKVEKIQTRTKEQGRTM